MLVNSCKHSTTANYIQAVKNLTTVSFLSLYDILWDGLTGNLLDWTDFYINLKVIPELL